MRLPFILLFLDVVSGSSLSAGYIQEVQNRFSIQDEIFYTFPPEPSWKSNALFRPLIGTVFTLVLPSLTLLKAAKYIELKSIRVSLLLALSAAFFVYSAFFLVWRLPETVLLLLPVLAAGYYSISDL